MSLKTELAQIELLLKKQYPQLRYPRSKSVFVASHFRSLPKPQNASRKSC